MSKSILYFTRSSILDDSKPLTVSELKHFLDRLMVGGYGSFKVLHVSRNVSDANNGITHYVLDDRDNTVLLD